MGEEKQYNTLTVFKMSLPIFVELLLQLLVGNIDQFMLSHYSEGAVAAVGNGNQIINIVIIFLNVMSVSTTILVSRYIGAKDKKKISEVCSVSVAVIIAISVLISTVILAFSKPLLNMLNVPQEIIGDASSYLKIICGFIIIQGLYLTIASALRSYTLMKDVMIASIIMNVINVIGNAILINGLFGMPRLGVKGAAISTNISKAIGLAILIIIFAKKTDAKIGLEYLRPFPKNTLKKLLYIGLPSGGEEMAYSMSQVVILMFINLFGTTVIATKVYASMLANVAYVYTMSITQATQIVIGHLVGSKQIDKIEERVKYTTFISMAVSLTVTIIIYFNSDTIFGIFTDNAEILSLGKKIIFIELFLEVGRAVNIVMTRCLLAMGDVLVPAIVTSIFAWVIAVVFSYIFGVRWGYGLVGIWIAMALDEGIRAIIFTTRFLNGKWKRKLIEG